MFYDAVQNLAFFQAGDQLRTLLGAALFENGAARDHNVAARPVHLEDLKRLLRAQQRGDIAHRPNVHLTARQKCHRAVQVDCKSALYAAKI